MTDKIKAIAAKHTEHIRKYWDNIGIGLTIAEMEMLNGTVRTILTEYESSEIARLRGIIERAKLVALKSLHVRGEVIDILSEAEEQ